MSLGLLVVSPLVNVASAACANMLSKDFLARFSFQTFEHLARLAMRRKVALRFENPDASTNFRDIFASAAGSWATPDPIHRDALLALLLRR
eukprot:6085525-Pyramimonas_sp.AAC.1